ncbi:MAG: adenylate kinase [Leptolyngbyaceae bacterium]|nr:adenylate kinase [Leptolyngbyaceae bacterium]
MRLLILGGPGAGKGTQAQQLCSYLNIPWISTGDMLREAVQHQTEFGEKVREYVEQGELVPDDIMIDLIRQRLLQPDATSGWLLDGYPRTAFQAEELDFLLDDLRQRLDWAIWLEVPPKVLMHRSIARSRQDDEPEIVQRRIDLFQERTIPILEYYDYRKRLLTINGDQPPEKIQQEIRQQLKV